MSNAYTGSGTKSFNELLREKESLRDVVPGQDPSKVDNNYQDKHTENLPDEGDKSGLPPAKVKRKSAMDILNSKDPTDERAGQVIDRIEQIITGKIKPTDYGLPGAKGLTDKVESKLKKKVEGDNVEVPPALTDPGRV